MHGLPFANDALARGNYGCTPSRLGHWQTCLCNTTYGDRGAGRARTRRTRRPDRGLADITDLRHGWRVVRQVVDAQLSEPCADGCT